MLFRINFLRVRKHACLKCIAENEHIGECVTEEEEIHCFLLKDRQ